MTKTKITVNSNGAPGASLERWLQRGGDLFQ